jgi:hypothetical protein
MWLVTMRWMSRAEIPLASCQVVGDRHRARVEGPDRCGRRHRRQRLPQRTRTRCRAAATLVPMHAFVTGEADEYARGRLGLRGIWFHHVMPAQMFDAAAFATPHARRDVVGRAYP